MQYALLFSGQGAQKPEMGLDFLVDPLFKETIEEASEASNLDLVKIFKSEHEELKKTLYVQPALVSFEAGIYRLLKRDLPTLPVAGMIGLSLGEYGAVYASGALNLSETIKLVTDRARYMQEDANQVESTMAALIKPDLAKVKEIIAQEEQKGQQVFIANYNSPVQVVIGGTVDAVKKTAKLIKEEAAAKKAIVLRVNGAFHTPLFNGAKLKMHKRLQECQFEENKIPVISNTTKQPFDHNWAEVLEVQLAQPTYFGADLQYLIKSNSQLKASLEIGPGKTLTAFTKQIDPNLNNYRIGTYQEYQDFINNYHEN